MKGWAQVNVTYPNVYVIQGCSQDFSKGGGGHTGSNNIVMAFPPRNTVGCMLKKGLQRGDHRHPRTPLATPLSLKTRRLLSTEAPASLVVFVGLFCTRYYMKNSKANDRRKVEDTSTN